MGDWNANDQWNGGIGIIDGFEFGYCGHVWS